MGDRFVAADVEHLAVARVGGARPQERVRGVVDVDEIAKLRAVAVDWISRPSIASLSQTDEPLPRVAHPHPRAVGVREPQRARAHAEDVVVEQMVVLAGRLVDAVHVDGHEVRLVDGQVLRPAVDLARAGEDDLHRRVVMAAGLEDRELAAAVDLEIRVRIAHGVDVARLAGEVEEIVLIADEVVQAVLVAHVGDVDRTRSSIPSTLYRVPP